MISRSLEFNKGKFFRVLAPPIYAFFYKKSLSWLFKYDGEVLDPFLPMLNFNIKKKNSSNFQLLHLLQIKQLLGHFPSYCLILLI